MLSTPNKALAALAAATLTATTLAVAVAPPAAVAAAPQQVDPLVMQVIAHQDDDLFFMNPDVDESITAGVPSVTVFLTAGQLTGDGATDGLRARNRQRGIQNAYATMAGVADGDDTTQLEWAGTPWRVADRTAELYLLRSRPDVILIFLNLHDGALRNIDTGGSDDTVVPTGGVVTAPVRYDRADVVRTLRLIMNTYRPTVLRTHDAEPDRRYTPDHTDHVATGRFAGEAAAGYPHPLIEVGYRDYNISDVPVNLSPAQVARKTRILAQYSRYDTAMRESGDGNGWLSRMYHRWPQGTGWVARNDQQELQAFFVRNGAVHHHPEHATAGWLGARRLADPGGAVAPGLSVARHPDGRLEVFAHRLSDHRIVSLAQQSPGGPFRSSWTDLGNPNTGLGNEDMIGTPAAATNADGRLQVFVKNGGGGLSTLRQSTAGGAWERTWGDLGGTDLQDGLSAVTTPQGRIEVFAATRESVLRWYQDRPDRMPVRDGAFRTPTPASAPRAAVDGQGRVTVAFRRAGTATMMQTTQAQPAATAPWQEPVDLGGAGLFEPGSVLAPDGRIMLFARQGSTVAATRQTAGGFGPWQGLGGSTLGPPAAALDAAQRVAVFSVGPTGLSVLRQDATGAEQPFTSWQDLGL